MLSIGPHVPRGAGSRAGAHPPPRPRRRPSGSRPPAASSAAPRCATPPRAPCAPWPCWARRGSPWPARGSRRCPARRGRSAPRLAALPPPRGPRKHSSRAHSTRFEGPPKPPEARFEVLRHQKEPHVDQSKHLSSPAVVATGRRCRQPTPVRICAYLRRTSYHGLWFEMKALNGS